MSRGVQTLRAAAVWYAKHGLPVFPCKPRAKEPLTTHGFKDATTDQARIVAWWQKWPDANIGMPTGAVSGLLVLDVDPRNGGDESLATLKAKHGDLPDTAEQMTGGGGRHILFRYPGGSVPKAVAPGIDIKGDGGYIVVAPSVHPSGSAYQWDGIEGPKALLKPAEAPAWLMEQIRAAHKDGSARVEAATDGAGVWLRGERNNRLASLAGTMRRPGMTREAIEAALLEENRRRCDPPLPEAEVRRIAESVARYGPGIPPEASTHLAELECFADIQPKPLGWVWRNRVPAGKLSLIVGDPDKGKSLITIDITARITTGKSFPDGAPSERGSVILLSAEDSAEDTIRPRLDAAGADVSRVHLLKAVRVVRSDGKLTERGFSLKSDTAALCDAIKQTPDVRLIVIDPISAYLGAADSHNNAEVRGLLAPLAELAARTGVAILAVTHLRKSSGSAIYRSMGSLAFAAAARAVWGIAEDTDDPDRRIMVRVKGDLSHDPGGLAYRIEVTLDIPRIAWEPGVVNLRADDVLGGLDSHEDRSERREAEAWLKEFLANGPKPASEVRRQSKEAGLALATVRRAADVLRIKKQKSGFDSGWEWRLP